MATTSAATTATHNEWWASRAKRRRDAELTLLRRPSETGSQQTTESTSSERQQSMSPFSSPQSAGSCNLDSHRLDQLYALQLQLQKNQAQIKTNEARMAELKVDDDRWGTDLQERLSAVMQLNEQLNSLRAMLEKVDRVSQGEFGVGHYDIAPNTEEES